MPLHVRAAGPAEAPTIVFLHGGGVGGWTWGPVAARLPEYHCLAPDLPEHGGSLDVAPFSIADAARHVTALIRGRAHGGHAHVVGLSIGSQVALELLATNSELVDHVVLSGTLLSPPPSEPPLPRRRGPTIVDSLRLLFHILTPIRGNALLVRGILLLSRIPQRYFVPYRADARLATVDSLMRIVVENFTYRPPPELRWARAATLAVVGADEPLVLRRSAREIAARLPNARAVLVPGVSHSWNLEAPDRFAQLTHAWLEGRPLPPNLVPLS